MNISFNGELIDEINNIKNYLEDENKGVTLNPSDAARWAISKQSQECDEKRKGS